MLQGFELLYLFQQLTPPSLKPGVEEAVLEEGWTEHRALNWESPTGSGRGKGPIIYWVLWK